MTTNGLFIFVFSAGLLSLATSCGSSKDQTAYIYPQPQPQQQEQQIQQPQNVIVQQPTKQKREVDECITLANTEDENKYRAYGTATSFQESYALQNAEANAVTAMVQRMETAVEGARQFYNKDANANAKKMTEGDAQGIITQYFVGLCKNYRVIKTNLYDLSDGSIQCYVCIEMRNTKDEFLNTVGNALTKDEVIAIDYDKERFMDSIKKGLEDYKKSITE